MEDNPKDSWNTYNVIYKISEIPDKIEYTDECKFKIHEALTAYNALTEEQKKLVYNYNKLSEADFIFSCEEEDNRIASVEAINKICKISKNIAYNIECKTTIDEARAACNAVKGNKQDLIYNYSVLLKAESEFEACAKQEDRLAAVKVINKINEILESIGYIPEYSIKKIEYSTVLKLLTNEQVYWVKNSQKLSKSKRNSFPAEFEEAVNKRALTFSARDAAIDKIKEFKKHIKASSQYKIKINEARTAYDTLTEKQKVLVENYSILTDAEKNLLSVEVENFINKFIEISKNMGNIKNIQEHKTKLHELRSAYYRLTGKQKVFLFYNSLFNETLSLLESELKTYIEAEKEKYRLNPTKVICKIKEIPNNVEYTPQYKTKIHEAIVAYNSLRSSQKELIPNYYELTFAINMLKSKKKAVDAANLEKLYIEISHYPIEEIIHVAKNIGLKVVNAIDIRKINKYKDLLKLLKALQTQDTKPVEAMEIDNPAVGQVIEAIKSISQNVEYLPSCLYRIHSARLAYNALTNEQKDLVHNYSVLELAEFTFEDELKDEELLKELHKNTEKSNSNKFETWGPKRDIYTWEKRANHATINSISNDPAIGDERNFVKIRKLGTKNGYSDNVVAEPGAEYEVFIFFHNNAAPELNNSSLRTSAQNIRLRMENIAASITRGQSAMIKGIISATNTEPKEVWDTAYIQTNQTVSLRYVKGSARLHNVGELNNKLISDEALFGGKYGGTFIGYDKWGLLPGGERYSGNVTFRIRVDKAGFDMNCTVSKENANDYKHEIEAVPGEILDFKIHFKNTGTTLLRNVSIYDLLGKGMEFVPGTTWLFNAVNPNGGLEKDNLFTNGFNIGDYKGGSDAIFTYKVKISDDTTLFPYGETVIVKNNAAAAIDVATIHDKVQVKVCRGYDN